MGAYRHITTHPHIYPRFLVVLKPSDIAGVHYSSVFRCGQKTLFSKMAIIFKIPDYKSIILNNLAGNICRKTNTEKDSGFPLFEFSNTTVLINLRLCEPSLNSLNRWHFLVVCIDMNFLVDFIRMHNVVVETIQCSWKVDGWVVKYHLRMH